VEKKSIAAEDFLKIKQIGKIVTNNRYVIWTESTPNSVEKEYSIKLRALDLNSGDIKYFSTGSKKDFNPKFSVDRSKLLFLSTRSGKPHAFIMDLEFGGEAQQITKHPNGIVDAELSPDGKKLLFSVRLDEFEINNEGEEKPKPKNPYEAELLKNEEEERQRQKFDPLVVEDLVYRSGTSYHDGRKVHIFIKELDNNKDPYRVTATHTHHLDHKWISNEQFVTISKLDEPTDLNHNISLLKFKAENEQQTGEIIYSYKGWFFGGLTSREKFVTVTEVKGGNTSADIGIIRVVDTESGKTYDVNSRFDRSVTQIHWISDDEMLLLVETHGKSVIKSYNVSTDQVTEVLDINKYISMFTPVEDSFYVVTTDPLHPYAIWKVKSSSGETLVEDPNSEFLENRLIIEPEEMWFNSPDGFKYQGWFFDAGLQNGKKPALTLSIHGGPHVMWNNAGSMWHEWQTFLAKGYSVLACNPQGSSGYGEEFAKRITAEWGLNDGRDLLLAVDAVIDRVDPENLFILGGSYAGFQTVNLIGKDHRFRAAVAQRGVYDHITFGLTTDIPLFSIEQWEGTPWDKLQYLWDYSPLSKAPDIKTPLLIIAAENDFRVAISQSEELFAALKLHKKEVTFVRYPRDGHEMSRSGEPLHVIDRIQRMIDWFEKYKNK
jgi:dipeptidyl aminopeptidase/acylaminoacyl peptidase